MTETTKFGAKYYHGEKPQLSALIEGARSNKPFTVRWESDRNYYGSYRNPSAFFRGIKKIKQEDKSFHEIIHDGYKWYKLYADIDCSADNYTVAQVVIEFESLMHDFFRSLELEPLTEFLYCNSSYGNKTSLHITSVELCFGHRIQQQKFWNMVWDWQIENQRFIFLKCEDKYEQVSPIDLNVYKRNKSYRLPLCVKRGESHIPERYLRPWNIEEGFLDDYDISDYIVYTNEEQENAWDVPFEDDLPDYAKAYDINSKEMEHVMNKNKIHSIILNAVPDVMIGEVEGNLIILTNIGTRKCIINGENNLTDNSYCTIRKDGIYFGCHDSGCQGQKKLIYKFENNKTFDSIWKDLLEDSKLSLEETKEILNTNKMPDDYNDKQIRIRNAALSSMNRNYCVIVGHAKPTVMKTSKYDDETTHSKLTINAFYTTLKNKGYQTHTYRNGSIKTVKANIAEMWMCSQYRNEKTHIGFFPQVQGLHGWKPTRRQKDTFNLYTRMKFIKNPLWNDKKKVSPLLKHLEKNWCDENKELYKYTIQWLAHCVQKPWEKKKVAITLRSMPGCGKGLVVDKMAAMMGDMYATVDIKTIKNYNGVIGGKLLIYLDETTWGGKKDDSGFLKRLISESDITINEKFISQYKCNNYASIIISSNSEWVIPADTGARRYLCLDLRNTFNGYSVKTNKWLKDIYELPAYDFYQYLMTVDISDFDITQAPLTEMLNEQITCGLTGFNRFWFDVLESGEYSNGQKLEFSIVKADLYDLFKTTGRYNIAKNTFTKKIKAMFGDCIMECRSMKQRAIKFESLKLARIQFDTTLKLNTEWETDEYESEPEPEQKKIYENVNMRSQIAINLKKK